MRVSRERKQANDLLDATLALPVAVAVLDHHGVIQAVNAAWRRFALEGGAPALAAGSAGLNYLATCRSAVGPGAQVGREAAEGIQAVLSGSRSGFTLEYPRRSAAGRRFFRLDVVAVAGGQGGALVSHMDITARMRPERATSTSRRSRAKEGVTQALTSQIAAITAERHQLRVSLNEEVRRIAAIASRRRQVETQLAERSSQLAGILEAVADGIVLYDASGTIVRVNQALITLCALDRDPELFGKPHVELARMLHARDPATGRPLSTEELPVIRALRGEVLAGPAALDVRLRALDGRLLDVNTSAAPIREPSGAIGGAVVVLRDVTERRRLERELAERSRLLELILSTMRDGIIVTDVQGHILLSNPAYHQLFALDHGPTFLSSLPAERAGLLSLSDPTSGRPLGLDEVPVTRALRGEVLAGSSAVDLRARALDGRELDVNVSALPMRDAEGQIIGGLSVYRDMTNRRRLERERASMMSLVSHELKHPLGILQMAGELIRGFMTRGRATQQSNVEEILDILDTGVVQMERLVNDLVEAARMESGHVSITPAPTDLAELARQVADEEMRLTGRSLDAEVPSRPVMANVDRMRIAQVLTNLIANAFKYSPIDVRVRLRLRRIHGEARFEVHDEGPGIPHEEQAHLFERFYQVRQIKAQQGIGAGLGLGLYICRQLVELHGGRIGVSSEVGRGSLFWFTLPLGQGNQSDQDHAANHA